jgi:hypothetical protein
MDTSGVTPGTFLRVVITGLVVSMVLALVAATPIWAVASSFHIHVPFYAWWAALLSLRLAVPVASA